MQSYSFNYISNPHNFPHSCSTKLLTLMKWVWYPIVTHNADAELLTQCEQSYSHADTLNVKELLADADAKLLTQCECILTIVGSGDQIGSNGMKMWKIWQQCVSFCILFNVRFYFDGISMLFTQWKIVIITFYQFCCNVIFVDKIMIMTK